jgi:hypothetical protein
VRNDRNDEDAIHSLAACNVWDVVWTSIERFVRETREVLARHLREGEIAARRLDGDAAWEHAELVVGRTRLRLECLRRCSPATASEPLAAAVFGARDALARIFVYRVADHDVRRAQSMLVASPARGLWITTDPELGPASLQDREALEPFFWSLVVDHR